MRRLPFLTSAVLLATVALLAAGCGYDVPDYSYSPRDIGQADTIVYGPHDLLYVLNPYHDAVMRWDVEKDQVKLFDVCQRPSDMALSPDARMLAVVCTHENKFTRIDLSTGDARTIDTNPLPWAVEIDPQGRRAVVAEYAGDSLLLIELETMTRRRVFIPGGPVEAAITPDGASAVVAAYWDNAVSIVDLETREVTRLADEPYQFSRPQDVLIGLPGTPSENLAFVANADHIDDEGRLASRIVAIDVRDGAYVGEVRVGPGPKALALSDDGSLLITVNTEVVEGYPARTASLVAIDEAGAMSEVQRFVVRRDALAAVALPGGQNAAVANFGDDSLSLLDLDELRSYATEVSVRPFGVACDPRGRYVYVAHDHPLGSLSIVRVSDRKVKIIDSLIHRDYLED
ncbi:MAG: hypothetical protein P9M14_08305 [Candidatus Alcyoniella australis]|nr:hypothetical protein [Candidatus Alcyoniella australis]